MLTLKCAACKHKLWKYRKFGQGALLRCHKDRITKIYSYTTHGDKVCCQCGQVVGIDKGSYLKMVHKGFTTKGTKINT